MSEEKMPAGVMDIYDLRMYANLSLTDKGKFACGVKNLLKELTKEVYITVKIEYDAALWAYDALVKEIAGIEGVKNVKMYV